MSQDAATQKVATPEADTPAAEQETLYFTAHQCGERFGFSARHWIRQVDAGRSPQPIRFGRLTRWSIQAIEQWEADGCPKCNGRS